MVLAATGDAEVDDFDVAAPFGECRAVVLERIAAPCGECPLKRDPGGGRAAESRSRREVAAQADFGSVKRCAADGGRDEWRTVGSLTGRQGVGAAIAVLGVANLNGREARDGNVADAPAVGFRIGRDVRPAAAKVDARRRASNDRSRHGALNCGYATR
jgi:hypothetical protein